MEKRGGARKGSGRKPKADEQKLIEQLNPMHPIALKALESGLNDSQSWAVKLFMEYYYGKPKQLVETKDVTDKTIKIEILDPLNVSQMNALNAQLNSDY